MQYMYSHSRQYKQQAVLSAGSTCTAVYTKRWTHTASAGSSLQLAGGGIEMFSSNMLLLFSARKGVADLLETYTRSLNCRTAVVYVTSQQQLQMLLLLTET
jgi:enoyl reductase-like protein